MNIVFQGFELVHCLQDVYFCLTFSSFAPFPNFCLIQKTGVPTVDKFTTYENDVAWTSGAGLLNI